MKLITIISLAVMTCSSCSLLPNGVRTTELTSASLGLFTTNNKTDRIGVVQRTTLGTFSKRSTIILYRITTKSDEGVLILDEDSKSNLLNGRNPWTLQEHNATGVCTFDANTRRIKPIRLNDDDKRVISNFIEYSRNLEQGFEEPKVSDQLYEDLPRFYSPND